MEHLISEYLFRWPKYFDMGFVLHCYWVSIKHDSILYYHTNILSSHTWYRNLPVGISCSQYRLLDHATYEGITASYQPTYHGLESMSYRQRLSGGYLNISSLNRIHKEHSSSLILETRNRIRAARTRVGKAMCSSCRKLHPRFLTWRTLIGTHWSILGDNIFTADGLWKLAF